MKKRVLSLLLILMMLSLLPLGALATKTDNIKQFNRYVCIGDGIAAGCGLDNNNVRGFEVVPGAYHSHVAASTGATVESLAHTGMRTVEVRWLLDDDYSASQESKDLRAMYFSGLHDILYWMDMKKNDPSNPDIARYADPNSEYYIRPGTRATLEPYCSYGAYGFKEYFRQNIQKADLCTVELGLNDIFLYAMKQTAAELNNPNANLITEITEFLRYMTIGQNAFKTNWAPMINAIKSYNPNIEIIVVGMYNPFSKVKAFSQAELVPVGRAADVMVASLNSYMKQKASDLGYKYADVQDATESIADVDITISPDDPAFFDKIIKGCYPSDVGHLFIANQILKLLSDQPNSNPSESKTVVNSLGEFINHLWDIAGRPEPKITSSPFADVRQDSPFYKASIWAAENQIVQVSSYFKPNDPCTRAEIATYLFRMEGSPAIDADIPYVDISAGKYYTYAVIWAANTGIIESDDPTHFKPDQTPCEIIYHRDNNTYSFISDHTPDPSSRVVTPPTCSQGYTTYTCTVCGRSYQVDFTDPVGHDYGDWETVYPPTCTEHGKDMRVCKYDSSHVEYRTIDPLDHDYSDWTILESATTEHEGKKVRICRRDNSHVEYQIIPKLESVENPFADIAAGKFYYQPVLWAISQNPKITTGVTDTTFMPERICTRAHVVTFLWRANGCPEPKLAANPFKDVPNGKYYYKAVLWAAENGITTGYSDGTFRPDDECTRGQVVTFLWRAEGQPAPTSTSNPFSDVPAGKYFTSAVLWALENGITTGKTSTTFAPDDACTRGHVVTFLYRDMA